MNLPGEELIAAGLSVLSSESGGEEDIGALLVSIGAPRLRSLGVPIGRTIEEPEARLYELLSREYGDAAHSRYNGYIRLLVSYERARACESGQVQSIFGGS